MRKLNLCSILLLLTVILHTTSCTKNLDSKDTATNANMKLDTIAYYESIGEEHNNALDYVYHRLRGAKDSLLIDFKDRDEVMLYTKAKIEEYLRYHSSPDIAAHDDTAIIASNLSFSFINDLFNSDEHNIYQLWFPSTSDSLSAKQKELLRYLYDTVDENNLQLTISYYEDIKIKVKNELPLNEQGIILAAISVGQHSFTYWKNNGDDWSYLFGSKGWSWGQLGKADGAGAVGGAVTCGGVAIFGGPVGWTAWGGAIVGGAAGASAYDACMQWWSK